MSDMARIPLELGRLPVFQCRPRQHRGEAHRKGALKHIGGRAFDVLAYLLGLAGQVVSRSALLEAVWPGTYVGEGSLRFQVAMLRKTLGNGHTSYIINVPGRGYCFTALTRSDSQFKLCVDHL